MLLNYIFNTVFRSKPQCPPSQSQLNLISNSDVGSTSFITNMKIMARDRNFWFIIFSLGLANGIWNSFGVLINIIYLNYFPVSYYSLKFEKPKENVINISNLEIMYLKENYYWLEVKIIICFYLKQRFVRITQYFACFKHFGDRRSSDPLVLKNPDFKFS